MVEASDADRTADTTTFLSELLGEVPPEKWALFWTLQNKSSSWVPLATGVEDVAVHARALSDEGMDVYVAVSVADEPGKSWNRIESANSVGLMGLWADIDIADPDVHKKWNLPPDEDAALQLLKDAGAEPTMVVHSGHGLQAWWLFPEFWDFAESPEERQSAALLAQKWNTTLRVQAAAKSWTVDSTFDLARVMRVPGTLNRKGSPVMPVRLISSGGPRWNPSDFEQYLVDEDHPALRGISPSKGYQPDENLPIGDHVPVPFEKHAALMENSEQFEKTWKRQRREFQDQSASSYDLSLTTQVIAAGWSDTEVHPLLRDWRRLHKEDVSKAYRLDYVRRTIAKAHDAVNRMRAADNLEDIGEMVEEAVRSGDPDAEKSARRRGLDWIGAQLDLELVHIIKTISDPANFAVVTPTRTIWLGGIEGIHNWFKFKARVHESVDRQIPRFKAAEWDRITDAMGKVWVAEDIGAEATEAGETESWLEQYLSGRPPVPTLDEAAPSEYPYIDDDGKTVMFGHAFKRWLWMTYQERPGNVAIGRRLRHFGCRPDKVNILVDGVRTSRSVWVLPTEKMR